MAQKKIHTTTKSVTPPSDSKIGVNAAPKPDTIIATHINADYDAIASLLAAQKLYPDAAVVFPETSEKNIKNFFINSMIYLFNMVDLKNVDFARINCLILVDTKRKNRLGKLAPLIEKPGIDIHIYDHHPHSADDIRSTKNHFRPTGATVTILIDMIRKKKLSITPEEATIMCLGIYEDTGSFTFSSTTEHDFLAAAYLLSNGANINTISDLIAREINPQQISILNDMIRSATHHEINGVHITLSIISTPVYITDFSFLVHKMVKMESLHALFAIARMEDKIYVVARSRISEVDVGKILSKLNGGGHAFAASASIKGKTLAQVETQLIDILYKNIRPAHIAKDVMSSPPIMIAPEISCEDAHSILTRYNINCLVVTHKENDTDHLHGFITRQVIDKALHHALGHVPVSEYMTSELSSIGPDADLKEIQEKIITNKQRVLPVIQKGSIIGVITRTDLLNILIHQSQSNERNYPDPLKGHIHARTKTVTSFMTERLPEPILALLKDIGATASDVGYPAYVVGGFVRDLFLYRPNEDIDIVIEGDGIEFAKFFARKTGARIHTHQKFGTAVIIFSDGFKIDVASARMEYYKFPASLPIVEMSSIKLDLFRRDFTINTLCIQLNQEKFGTLIDFFAAQRDIKDKAIRILHNLSFVEDPTRVFRAIRFEQRFGFTIGKLTSGLIKNAVKMDFFKQLSGRRMFSELRQILGEENPVPALLRLDDYSLLNVIHPAIGLDTQMIELLNNVRKVIAWHDLLFLGEACLKWMVYLLALMKSCNRKISYDICARFELNLNFQAMICKKRFAADECLYKLSKRLPTKNSLLYNHLSGFKTELLLYMMAAARKEKVKKAISLYFTQLRDIRISINGADLKKLGIAPGPIYREIFIETLNAKLNNDLKTKNDELRFVKNYVS